MHMSITIEVILVGSCTREVKNFYLISGNELKNQNILIS